MLHHVLIFEEGLVIWWISSYQWCIILFLCWALSLSVCSLLCHWNRLLELLFSLYLSYRS